MKRKSKRRRRINKILWVLIIGMGISEFTICAINFIGKRKDGITSEVSEIEITQQDSEEPSLDKNDSADTERIAEILSDIYDEAAVNPPGIFLCHMEIKRKQIHWEVWI